MLISTSRALPTTNHLQLNPSYALATCCCCLCGARPFSLPTCSSLLISGWGYCWSKRRERRSFLACGRPVVPHTLSVMAPDYRLVWFLFILVLLARSGLSQSVGEFPQPVTISLNKPITASSTCGVASAREYCQYAVSLEESIEPNCMSSICNDTCTFSSTSPTPQDLSSLGTYGSGVTLVSGRSNDDSSSALKFVNSYISIPSSNLSQFGSNGFTFASWIKQDAGNTG